MASPRARAAHAQHTGTRLLARSSTRAFSTPPHHAACRVADHPSSPSSHSGRQSRKASCALPSQSYSCDPLNCSKALVASHGTPGSARAMASTLTPAEPPSSSTCHALPTTAGRLPLPSPFRFAGEPCHAPASGARRSLAHVSLITTRRRVCLLSDSASEREPRQRYPWKLPSVSCAHGTAHGWTCICLHLHRGYWPQRRHTGRSNSV